MKFIYPAVFHKTEEGHYKGYFPDLECCYGEGETLDEAIESAKANAARMGADVAAKSRFFCADAGQAATSLLQRRCKLGYARAARIMDEMEQKGIIGPYEGAKPRAVLISRQQWLEMQMNQPEE